IIKLLRNIKKTRLRLYTFKVITGIAAAIVTSAFPHTERGKAMGIIGTVVSVGSMTGPVLGGFSSVYPPAESCFSLR
ncbi:MAG: MFS transporter, partial [Methanosarcinaceae archaeon]